MSEDSSDNFSVDSLEEDDRTTTIKLPDVETQTTVAVEENAELKDINDEISVTENRNNKFCAFSVPFYSGSMSLSDIQKIQKTNMRSKVNEKTFLSLSEKAGQTDRSFTARNKRIERWRSNVKLNNTISLDNRKLVKNNTQGNKVRSQSLIPVCVRSMVKMKLDDIPKRRVSNESHYCLSKQFNSVVSVNNVSRNITPKTYGQNQKSSSYLEQYRLRKYGRHYDKGDASNGYASTVFSDTETRSMSCLPKQNQDSSKEYSEDMGISYMEMIDDGLHVEHLDNNCVDREYQVENSSELTPTTHNTSSEQCCLESSSVVEVGLPTENNKKSDIPKYVPYTVNDYRVLLPTQLGKLGPDVAANKDKIERVLKRREYGELANMRNREIIRLKNMKQAKIQATKSETNVSTLSLEPNNRHGNSKSLPLNSKNAINTFVVRKRIVNEKVPSQASLSNQESQNNTQSFNEEDSTNKTHTKKMDEQTSDRKEKLLKSNKDKIIQMQERHVKEFEVIEDIRKTHILA